MRQIFEFLIDLWQTGNWWARAAVLFVVLGPFFGLVLALAGFNGFAAAATLVSFVSLIILPFIWSLVTAAVIGVLGHQPRGREIFRWIALYIGGLLTYGFYLYWVPVSTDPVLVIPLVLALGASVFLTLGGAGGFFFKWLKRGLAVAVAVITVIFFLGGREWFVRSGPAETVVQQKTPQPVGAIGQIEEFTVNANEEVDTVATWEGTQHRVFADHEWILVSAKGDGTFMEYQMPAGRRSIVGTGVEGPARVKGVRDGTAIRFERVR